MSSTASTSRMRSASVCLTGGKRMAAPTLTGR